MNQYTPRNTVGEKYGNLAAGINSTKNSSIGSILTISNSPRDSALLE